MSKQMNITQPLISVVVPVYNVEKYLRECLDSILAQTYQNIEVILVDDGSKDSSGVICDEYAQRHENFRVVHKENAGLGMARNTGLEYVNGEYVTFVDSDDYIAPELIETLAYHMSEKRVDICKGGFARVTDDHHILSSLSYEEEKYEGELARKEFLPRMLGSKPDKKDSIEMCVWGAVYKTAHIKKYGIRFPSEREVISEDLVFNIDYMQYADGAYITSFLGYFYRVNWNSLTKSYRADRFEAVKHFYRVVYEKLENLGYNQSEIQRLQRLFFVYVRMCIAQEIPERSHKTKADNLMKIKMMCNDDLVKTIIKNYPAEQLGLKQQAFIKLIDWCMYRVLFLCARLGKL